MVDKEKRYKYEIISEVQYVNLMGDIYVKLNYELFTR